MSLTLPESRLHRSNRSDFLKPFFQEGTNCSATHLNSLSSNEFHEYPKESRAGYRAHTRCDYQLYYRPLQKKFCCENDFKKANESKCLLFTFTTSLFSFLFNIHLKIAANKKKMEDCPVSYLCTRWLFFFAMSDCIVLFAFFFFYLFQNYFINATQMKCSRNSACWLACSFTDTYVRFSQFKIFKTQKLDLYNIDNQAKKRKEKDMR